MARWVLEEVVCNDLVSLLFGCCLAHRLPQNAAREGGPEPNSPQEEIETLSRCPAGSRSLEAQGDLQSDPWQRETECEAKKQGSMDATMPGVPGQQLRQFRQFRQLLFELQWWIGRCIRRECVVTHVVDIVSSPNTRMCTYYAKPGIDNLRKNRVWNRVWNRYETRMKQVWNKCEKVWNSMKHTWFNTFSLVWNGDDTGMKKLRNDYETE